MPNWCQNEVTVTADTKGTLQNFINFVKSSDVEFSFQSIMPMPSELTGTCSPVQICTVEEYHDWIRKHQPTYDFEGRPITKQMSVRFKKQYGTDNWYDWCNNNWGTKWDTASVYVDKFADTTIHYSFDTAWLPPVGVYSALVKLFPDLHFSWFYREEGMAIAGYLPN